MQQIVWFAKDFMKKGFILYKIKCFFAITNARLATVGLQVNLILNQTFILNQIKHLRVCFLMKYLVCSVLLGQNELRAFILSIQFHLHIFLVKTNKHVWLMH